MTKLLQYSRKSPLLGLRLCRTSTTSSLSRTVSKDEDYQYLEKSSLPTMHFQQSLLRLPIPDLNVTCDKYLRSQQAIVNPDDANKIRTIVEDFKKTTGPLLHENLLTYDKENPHTSYISKPWFDMYLKDRVPLVLNYNPFFAFQPETHEFYSKPAVRATNIIVSSMRFMRSLKELVLSPEVYHLNPKTPQSKMFQMATSTLPPSYASYGAYVFKSFPLDMSQFENLFHSTRIPMMEQDRIQKFHSARHILLMKKGNFYVFDLFDQDGNLHDADRIYACVKHVMDDPSPPAESPIGILTTQDRDIWAMLRNKLEETNNSKNLQLIDSAAFNFAFDDDVTVELDPQKCFDTFLTGNGANRWFDKSFSILMTGDGMASVNFEHAWGDGVAVMRYFNEVAKEIANKSWISEDTKPTIDASNLVRKLEFNITEDLKSVIQQSMMEYEEKRQSLKVDVLESDIFGRKLCKQFKVSPDAIMQLGFQIGHYLQYGKGVSTYESCSTAAFKHGRTETLRPATLETRALCEALIKPQDQWPSKSELKNMILKCSEVHGNLTKEAAMGKGFDRHLFGMKWMSELLNMDLHPIYTDEISSQFNKFIISTSTLPSPEISIGGFAPVVKGGLGIGYRMQDDGLGLVASTYKGQKDGQGFIENVEKAYKLISDILKEN